MNLYLHSSPRWGVVLLQEIISNGSMFWVTAVRPAERRTHARLPVSKRGRFVVDHTKRRVMQSSVPALTRVAPARLPRERLRFVRHAFPTLHTPGARIFQAHSRSAFAAQPRTAHPASVCRMRTSADRWIRAGIRTALDAAQKWFCTVPSGNTAFAAPGLRRSAYSAPCAYPPAPRTQDLGQHWGCSRPGCAGLNPTPVRAGNHLACLAIASAVLSGSSREHWSDARGSQRLCHEDWEAKKGPGETGEPGPPAQHQRRLSVKSTAALQGQGGSTWSPWRGSRTLTGYKWVQA